MEYSQQWVTVTPLTVIAFISQKPFASNWLEKSYKLWLQAELMSAVLSRINHALSNHAVKQHIRHHTRSKAAWWTCVKLHSPLNAYGKLTGNLDSQHRIRICMEKMSQKGTGLGIRKFWLSQPYRWRLMVAQSILEVMIFPSIQHWQGHP